MKSRLLVIISTFFITLYSHHTIAQVEGRDKTKDVKILLKLINYEKDLSTNMIDLVGTIEKRVKEQFKGDDAKNKTDRYMDFVLNRVLKITDDVIQKEAPSIYEKHFTHQEILGMIQFYSSPAGRKLIEKSGTVLNELNATVSSKYMFKFNKEITQKLSQMKQE